MIRLHKEPEQHLEDLYKRINEYYETITREMINQIVHRIDDISDLYFEICYPDLNPQQKRKNENNLLTKRILNNKTINEASTFDTVLNFICAVHHFIWTYDNEPHRLFHHAVLSDWMICALRKVDLKWKDTFIYNDDTIPDTVNRFLSIDDDEITRLVCLYRDTYLRPDQN